MPTRGGSRGSIGRTSPLSVSCRRTSRTGGKATGRGGGLGAASGKRGPAPGPAHVGLELGGQRQQRLLAVRGTDELHAERQAPVAQARGRHGAGRLARCGSRSRCRDTRRRSRAGCAAALIPSHSAAPTGGLPVVGVTSTSKSAKIRLIRSACTAESRLARSTALLGNGLPSRPKPRVRRWSRSGRGTLATSSAIPAQVARGEAVAGGERVLGVAHVHGVAERAQALTGLLHRAPELGIHAGRQRSPCVDSATRSRPGCRSAAST